MVVSQSSTMPDGLVQLLESTTFGSDGLQYRRLCIQQQLQRFNHPEFFSAWSGNELIGTYVIDRRDLLIENLPLSGFYRGALAVRQSWQGKGVAKELARLALQWINNQGESTLSYGCIDADNKRSLAVLASQGATEVGRLSMFMMYRQWPRTACDLVPLNEALLEKQVLLGRQNFSDCLIRDITNNTQAGSALIDGDGIAISARMSLSAFRITRMSQFARWATRLFVTPWPPARKRFNPLCFRYLSLSDVVIRDGCETQWPAFVSTIMAKYGVHFSALYLDPRAEFFHRMRTSHFLGPIVHSSRGNISIVAKAGDCGNRLVDIHNDHRPWCVWPVDA